MYFDHIQTFIPLSTPTLLPSHLDFLSSIIIAFLRPIEFNLCLPCAFTCFQVQVYPLESGQSTRHQTSKENCLSLSQNLSVANRSLAKSWVFCPPLPSMLGSCLTWVCAGLVHVVTSAVNSYVQLPCGVQTARCSCIHLWSLSLRIFLPPLPQ